VKKVRCIGVDNLADTINELQGASGRISIISGGTNFTIAKNRPNPDCIVDLSKVHDLKFIIEDNNFIRIGAGTTFAEIAAHHAVQTKIAALAQAAGQIGPVQNRNRATIGGNIASASPAGDSLPVLAVFEARIVTAGPEGSRTLLVEEVIAGACQSTLGEKEIIKEIVFPVNNCLSAFRKIGRRTTVARSRLNMAVLLDYCHKEDTILNGKIVLGAVGSFPVCPKPVSDYLRGRKVDKALAGELSGLMSEVVNEIKPVAKSRPYKAAAVKDCGRCGWCLDDRASRPYKASAVKGLVYDIATDLFGDRFEL
jgi:carbon-monoxide dehydrogenase medium subunit